jgi:ATP-dependent Clp protease ATP-binding subunit ClpA
MEALTKMFTPEFRNRLDSIIQFAALARDTVCYVVDKFLTELQAQLDEKQVVLHVTDEVKEYLADKGYDQKMGARPMARLIQEELKKPLAEEILFGSLSGGGDVNVTLVNNALSFDFDEVPA